MEERSQEETPSSWHRRYPGLIVVCFLVVLALLALAFALYGLPLVLGLLGGGCPCGQRAVLQEFDHYESRGTWPYAAETSCNARYRHRVVEKMCLVTTTSGYERTDGR